MTNLVDLIQMKVSSTIPRETIELVLNEVINSTREHLEQGGDVYWGDFATFSFKKALKPRAKKGTVQEEPAIEEEVATILMASKSIKGTLSKEIKKPKK